jgi:hypothetical protein
MIKRTEHGIQGRDSIKLYSEIVPVDVTQLVHRRYGKNHLGYVEPGHVFGQSILELAQERQQIATAVVVHNQVLNQEKYNALYVVLI